MVLGDDGAGGDVGVGWDGGVFGDDGAWTDVDVVANRCTTGDADTGHQGTAIADGGVVAEGAAGQDKGVAADVDVGGEYCGLSDIATFANLDKEIAVNACFGMDEGGKVEIVLR